MSDFFKASEDVKALVKRFQPLLSLSEELERIGGIDQAAKEADIRKAKALADADVAVKALEMKSAELQKADAAIGASNEKNEKLLAYAQERARAIISEANENAKSVMDAAFLSKAAVLGDIQKVKVDQASILSDIQNAKAELESIQNQIKEFRSKISAFAKL